MLRMQAITLVTTAYALLGLLFVAFCFSAIGMWHLGYGWHDQQRFYQILLLCACAPLAALLPQAALSGAALLLLAGLFTLGLYSSLLAAWPEWALREWSRYVGLLLLALVASGLRVRAAWEYFILWAMAAVGFIHAYQFLVYYLMAFVTGIRMLDADILFSGFSNPRFFGQFQVMLLPVMALLIEKCRQQRRTAIALLLGLALVTQWCIAFTLGGRGMWLGLLVGHLALLLVNYRLWRILALQVGAALLGCLLFLLLFKLIPQWLELDPILRDNLRAGLSGRERIWQMAWEMALVNPWLGVGPMHYSAVYNPIAAHPHQVVLQWLAEWGFPAAFMALALGVWGLQHSVRHLRAVASNELDAGLWLAILGALVLAQVDGVFVMPYTETWLALLIGIALARWAKPATPLLAQQLACAIVAIPVLVVLGKVLINEAPGLFQDYNVHMGVQRIDGAPRFWSQGWIPNRGVAD
ncbi:O-antigen ligase [Pseudomonas seleniipraecipitans]|uniref:O-antigen ligase n=2 Tax=Phytopseudomonas seleniipraecipitans TaxID=640205 RepID=A0A1G7KN16_9GAMM|nr:O-antigen ligase [Pseudomonas seleniipraecipitans]